LASPKRDEREVGIELLARAEGAGGETVIGDKGYAGPEIAKEIGELEAMIVRPARKDETRSGLVLCPLLQLSIPKAQHPRSIAEHHFWVPHTFEHFFVGFRRSEYFPHIFHRRSRSKG